MVHPATNIQGEVQGSLGAESLASTNVVLVAYRGPDPLLAPKILDRATAALQAFGRDRVRDGAQRELDFITTRLDSAMTLLQASSREISDFKESAEFTNLSVQEQQLLNNFQRADDLMQAYIAQQDALQALTINLEQSGVEGVDLVAFMAVLPAGVNPQIRGIADDIQERKDEVQTLLTEDRLTEEHNRVIGVRRQLATREAQLRAAVAENLIVLAGQIAAQQTELD